MQYDLGMDATRQGLTQLPAQLAMLRDLLYLLCLQILVRDITAGENLPISHDVHHQQLAECSRVGMVGAVDWTNLTRVWQLCQEH